MKSIVVEICRAKQQARIEPALATEVELKHELSRRGVKWTPEAFERMRRALERDPDIITRRCRNYNAYECKTEDLC